MYYLPSIIYIPWSRDTSVRADPLLVLAYGDLYYSSYDEFYSFCWWYGWRSARTDVSRPHGMVLQPCYADLLDHVIDECSFSVSFLHACTYLFQKAGIGA